MQIEKNGGKKVATNLRRLMFEQDVSISEVSRKTGISRTTLTNLYKNAGGAISFQVLEKLCLYFNCQVGDILKIN